MSQPTSLRVQPDVRERLARGARGRTDHGLVLFVNRSFPRHRPDVFVPAMVQALDALLDADAGAPDGHVVWLSPAG